jgi:hypothetical protein
MTYASVVSNAALLSVIAVAGFACGFAYFAILRRTAEFYGSGRTWFGPIGFTLGRIAGAAIFFASTAKLGTGPLLAAFFGFLLARTAAVHTVRRSG